MSQTRYLEGVSVGDAKRLADRLGIPFADLVNASRDLAAEAQAAD